MPTVCFCARFFGYSKDSKANKLTINKVMLNKLQTYDSLVAVPQTMQNPCKMRVLKHKIEGWKQCQSTNIILSELKWWRRYTIEKNTRKLQCFDRLRTWAANSSYFRWYRKFAGEYALYVHTLYTYKNKYTRDGIRFVSSCSRSLNRHVNHGIVSLRPVGAKVLLKRQRLMPNAAEIGSNFFLFLLASRNRLNFP